MKGRIFKRESLEMEKLLKKGYLKRKNKNNIRENQQYEKMILLERKIRKKNGNPNWKIVKGKIRKGTTEKGQFGKTQI